MGITLASMTVGNYLLSDYITSTLRFFIDLIQSEQAQLRMTDTLIITLVLATNLCVYKDFMKQLRDTSLYKYICCVENE